MSHEQNQAPTDLEEKSSDDQKEVRIAMPYKEKNTYLLLKETLIDVYTSQCDSFDPSMSDSKNPDAYLLQHRNLLFNFCNAVITGYKQTIKYQHDHLVKKRKEEQYQPDNRALEKRNDYFREELEKAFHDNQKTEPEKMRVDLSVNRDATLEAEEGGIKMPVTQLINKAVKLEEEIGMIEALEKEKRNIKRLANGLVDALEEKNRRLREVRAKMMEREPKRQQVRIEPETPQFARVRPKEETFSNFK